MSPKKYLFSALSLFLFSSVHAQYYKPSSASPVQFVTPNTMEKMMGTNGTQEMVPPNLPPNVLASINASNATNTTGGAAVLPNGRQLALPPANDIRLPAPPLETAGTGVAMTEMPTALGGAMPAEERPSVEVSVSKASSSAAGSAKVLGSIAKESVPVIGDLKKAYPQWNAQRSEYYEKKSAERLEKIALQASTLMQMQYQPPANAHPNFRKDLALYIQRARDFGIAPEKVELELRTRSPENFIAWVKRATQ